MCEEEVIHFETASVLTLLGSLHHSVIAGTCGIVLAKDKTLLYPNKCRGTSRSSHAEKFFLRLIL